MNEAEKFIVSILLGIWATFFDKYAMVLGFIIIAIVLDLITGLIKAKVTGERWKSKKGYKGFWKKISLLVAFAFGVFLDYYIPYVLDKIVSTELPFNSPFALIIGAYIVLNESISVCENLYEINPHTLPQWIKSLLSNANDTINKKGKD